VLLFGLLPLLDPEAIDRLLEQVTDWTAPGGLLFVTAFTTEDSAHARCAAGWACRGRNSYASSEGDIRTFLEPGEILTLLPEWSALHHREGLGPEHRHGDGELERHALAEAVLRRPG
jgi:O-methyltransferase involved in polyketide biosynthesis